MDLKDTSMEKSLMRIQQESGIISVFNSARGQFQNLILKYSRRVDTSMAAVSIGVPMEEVE